MLFTNECSPGFAMRVTKLKICIETANTIQQILFLLKSSNDVDKKYYVMKYEDLNY